MTQILMHIKSNFFSFFTSSHIDLPRGPKPHFPVQLVKEKCTTCLERAFNIFYCSLIIAFQDCCLNAFSFMGSEKIPFTSSWEQSGNLGCGVSCHLCPCAASLLLFGCFMRPDSLARFSHDINRSLCRQDVSLVCCSCKYDNAGQKIFPTLAFYCRCVKIKVTAQSKSSSRKSTLLGVAIQTWPCAQGHDVWLHVGSHT